MLTPRPCAHIILREHCFSMLTKIKVSNSTPPFETAHGNHKRTLLSFKTHFFFYSDKKRLCITIMSLHYHFEIKSIWHTCGLLIHFNENKSSYSYSPSLYVPTHCAHSFCFLLIQFPANLLFWSNTKFSASCFPRLEAWWRSHWSKVTVPGKPCFFFGLQRNPLLLFLLFSGGFLIYLSIFSPFSWRHHQCHFFLLILP